jgi:hypothetical protein
MGVCSFEAVAKSGEAACPVRKFLAKVYLVDNVRIIEEKGG